MKKTRIIHNIYFYITLVFLLFPVLPIFGRSTAVGLWSIVTLILIIKEKKKTNKPLFLLLLFSSLFLFYSLSILYSENIQLGFSLLFQRISLILFPILFFFHPNFYKKDKIKYLIHFFGYVLLAFLSILIIYLIYTGIINEIKTANNPVVFIRHQFGKYTWLHPSYLSLYLCFIFLSILIHLMDKWKVLKQYLKSIHSIALVYIILLLLLLSAKMSIIAVVSISILLFFIKSKSKLKATLFSILILGVSLLIINTHPTTKVRFKNMYSALTTATINNKNPDSIRRGMYKSAISLAQKSILLGVGIGDTDYQLIKQYRYDKQNKAARLKLNTHNQYLEVLLSTGIIGLILFILSLLVPIYISLIHKDYTYFAFLALISLCLLTENMLSRQAGVTFFAFFNSLFAFNLCDKKNTIFVNGRFLTKSITGVQRFATEIGKELALNNQNIEFLTPSEIKPVNKELNLRYSILKPFKSHFWEQVTLPLYLLTCGKPLLINLENTAPAFYKKQIATIHDLSFEENPKWFSKKYSLFYKLIIPRICKNAWKILTVSKFSKKEIINHYNIDCNKIKVIYNALPNALKNIPSPKFEAQKEKYILTVGSIEPRKNLQTLINSFNELETNMQLIIVGNINPDVFNKNTIINKKKQNPQIKFITNATDEELANLYKNAICFIYIPLYEGFGLPVIEAMHFGCPTIISDIEVFKEIYKESAIFVNPQNTKEIKEKIAELITNENLQKKYSEAGYSNTKEFSYKSSAQEIISIISQKINKT